MNENQDRERFISIIEETRGPTCPNCDSDNWDFTNNDEAQCSDCGYQWTQETEDEIDIPALMAATTSAMLEAFLPDVTLVTLDQANELRRWYEQ